jgi:hypothetical protein
MVSLDWIWNIEWVGFIGGPGLLLFWWLVVKVNTGKIFEKRNQLATFLLAPPGIILTISATYLFLTSEPWRSEIYVVNYTQQPGRLELDGQSYNVDAGRWEHISFRNSESIYSVRGFVGDSLVFEVNADEGIFLSLLGGRQVLSVEEIVYSRHHADVNYNELIYKVLENPGLLKFSNTKTAQIFDFYETVPMKQEQGLFGGDEHTFKLTIHEASEFRRQLFPNPY